MLSNAGGVEAAGGGAVNCMKDRSSRGPLLSTAGGVEAAGGGALNCRRGLGFRIIEFLGWIRPILPNQAPLPRTGEINPSQGPFDVELLHRDKTSTYRSLVILHLIASLGLSFMIYRTGVRPIVRKRLEIPVLLEPANVSLGTSSRS